MFVVTLDHPYWGEITMRHHRFNDLLSDALQYEHGECEDTTGCDVANMVAGGFVRIAADRMRGATECPVLDAVMAKYPRMFSRAVIERDENEWWDTVKDVSVFCPECSTLLHGQHVYLDDSENLPDYCTNCAKGFDPSKATRPSRGR